MHLEPEPSNEVDIQDQLRRLRGSSSILDATSQVELLTSRF